MKAAAVALPLQGEPPSEVGRLPLARFALGFRPFFLAASLHAAVFVPVWVAALELGWAPGNGIMPAVWWHAHEMVFGFTLAVIAGFLLTAARNWTGRDTAHGAGLLALVALWAAGRAAMVIGGAAPTWAVAAVCTAFPLALALVIGRVLIAARSRRNYGVLVILAVLAAASALTHLGAARGDAMMTRTVLVSAVHLIVLLTVVIGGRIVPLFTKNATGDSGIGSDVRLDRVAIGASAALVVAVATSSPSAVVAAAALVSGFSNLLRMRTWGTRRALREPMLAVLHVGYAWIGVGQLLVAASAAGVAAVPASTALHALTIGVIGTMTIGMMVRVALGHTGRSIVASSAVRIAFALVGVAALARVVSIALPIEATRFTILIAGLAFASAHVIVLGAIGPVLLSPRPDGRPG